MSRQKEMWYPAAREENVVARFEYYDQLDVEASRQADEKIYRQIIVCRQKITGDPDETYVPVRAHNQNTLTQRFPDAWKAFNGEEIPVNGTPLTELDLSESTILGFRINGINVVEQVVTLSDAQCEKIGFGTRMIRKAAIDLMENRKKAIMDAAMAQVAANVAAGAAPVEKRKPGRPRKTETVAASAA